MEYLKPEQYYSDRYDLHTIETCMRHYSNLKIEMYQKRDELNDHDDETFEKEVHKMVSYFINTIKIDRFRYKKEKLDEWMDRDRQIQEKYDQATPLDNLLCHLCNSPTKVMMKDMFHAYDENAQVLFMYECVNCEKRQAFFEDGSEWKPKEKLCPNCHTPVEEKAQKDDRAITTTYWCNDCSHTDQDVLELTDNTEFKERESREKALLEKYRDEFCYTDEVGLEAVHSFDRLIAFVKGMREKEKQDKDPVFQQARQLKKLRASKLQEIIRKAVESKGYMDLQFDKPELGKYVTIGFSVNDTNEEREEYDSRRALKRIITNSLKDTNWRLMTEGISYRIGILTGKLKAYERGEDLAELLKREQKTKH